MPKLVRTFVMLLVLGAASCHDPVDPYIGADTLGNVHVAFDANPARWEADPITIDSARIEGDVLYVNATHGGGCRNHSYAAVAWNGWLESIPVQVGIFLAHEGHGDMCRALVTPQLRFDLTSLKNAFRQAYGSGESVMVLRLNVADSIETEPTFIRYTFAS